MCLFSLFFLFIWLLWAHFLSSIYLLFLMSSFRDFQLPVHGHRNEMYFPMPGPVTVGTRTQYYASHPSLAGLRPCRHRSINTVGDAVTLRWVFCHRIVTATYVFTDDNKVKPCTTAQIASRSLQHNCSTILLTTLMTAVQGGNAGGCKDASSFSYTAE